MGKSERRFYVRNLPADVGEEDVRSYFGDIGEIFDVSVKSNFGFFSVKGSSRSLDHAITKYSEKEWKGNFIKLEKAEKDNFMARLAKERELAVTEKAVSDKIAAPDNTLNNSPRRSKFKKKHGRRSSVSSDGSGSEINEKAGVRKFRGTCSLVPDNKYVNSEHKILNVKDTMTDLVAFDSMWADNGEHHGSINVSSFLTNKNNSACVNPSKRVKVKPANEKQESSTKGKVVPMSKIEKKRRDDERRRHALAEKVKEKKKQQNMIQSALSTFNAHKSNKIVFGSEDGSENEEDKKTKLFDLFDNQTHEDSFAFPDKEHFEGDKGCKLLILQTQFNNDGRFKMDARFLEDGSGDENSHELEHSKHNRPYEMIRFDPSRSESSGNKGTMVNELKSRKKFQETKAPIVSKEKFYEVSNTIKSALRENTSGFSLLETYGGKNKQVEERQCEESQETKIRPIAKRNPLIMDSSDDESIVDNREDCKDDEPLKIWAPQVNLPSGPRDNFFFADNDSIIAEAMEFMNKKNSEDAKQAAANFDTTRRVLKKIFKDQVLKRAKKTDMFKKKVGGMKKRQNTKGTAQSNGHFRNNSRYDKNSVSFKH